MSRHDGSRSDRCLEEMDPGTLPLGHRLGIRHQQALQAAQHGHRVHGTQLPRHTLPDPP